MLSRRLSVTFGSVRFSGNPFFVNRVRKFTRASPKYAIELISFAQDVYRGPLELTALMESYTTPDELFGVETEGGKFF